MPFGACVRCLGRVLWVACCGLCGFVWGFAGSVFVVSDCRAAREAWPHGSGCLDCPHAQNHLPPPWCLCFLCRACQAAWDGGRLVSVFFARRACQVAWAGGVRVASFSSRSTTDTNARDEETFATPLTQISPQKTKAETSTPKTHARE